MARNLTYRFSLATTCGNMVCEAITQDFPSTNAALHFAGGILALWQKLHFGETLTITVNVLRNQYLKPVTYISTTQTNN